MLGNRPKLYLVALVGMALFGAIVLIDWMRPGLMTPEMAIGASLGMALCGLGVIALRPRTKRAPTEQAQPKDFTAVLEERRKMADKAAQRPPRLPTD